MADMRPQTRAGRPGDRKPGAGRSAARTRREQFRRRANRTESGWKDALRRPASLQGLLIALLFVCAAGALLAWANEQPSAPVGRVMTESRVVRMDFELEDRLATSRARDLARARAPRAYTADMRVLEDLETSLKGLPTALAEADTLEKVSPSIREAFGLTQERLDAIREHVVAGEADQVWARKIERLMGELRSLALVDAQTYQIENQLPNMHVELHVGDEASVRAPRGRVLNVEGEQFVGEIRRVVREAGFTEPSAGLVVDRLTRNVRPTFSLSESLTEQSQLRAAEAVDPEMTRYRAGLVIAQRGRVLYDDAAALLQAEHETWMNSLSSLTLWSGRLGAAGVALIVTMGMGAYVTIFCPRIRRNPMRIMAIVALMGVMLTIAVTAGVMHPGLAPLAATAPVVFFAVIMAIAYDQRTALALASLHALLVGTALGLPLAFYLVALSGLGVAAWRLREIRHRNALIYAGFWAGSAMAIATVVTAPLTLPLGPNVWMQIVTDALWTGAGGVLVGFVTLGILPTVERAFGITTGMTLIELRDPKQPLLRELQQRAPGTYQHSFTVATLAETAADAIGADRLHLFVGALYHDIGKMNKPDYFVENQSGQFNRHSKLSPAMSLLVIVGHVKDGMELAKEYGLPRSLHHYIESHHGTTLVEYFYHAAQQKADETDVGRPQEIEYRYPGPRPHSKEAAILMLCDAVESATRAMSDPTPSRIETLVHELAGRRLMDGQFDECDLTLRELHVIEASLVKTLCSVYHGRVAYPTSQGKDEQKEKKSAEDARKKSEGEPAERTA
ncbi:MAG: HDIG domain-containing protein [Phycisphaeraceae bacterium]|nr:MAG: HDIG domain-containing protein [Phycisphaeraceae bacterium]